VAGDRGGRRQLNQEHGAVAVVGEALIDLVPRDPDGLYQAVPGGSPANVAVGLARLQVPARMVARVADDPFGRRIRRHLAGNGVDLGAVVTAAEPTSLAIVEVEPDGAVSYDFRVDGTADWQWRDAELDGVLGGGLLALHAGSLALTMPPGADVLLRLLQRARGGVTISYDPNARPLLMGSPERTLERVERLVALADVVKASVEDVAWLLPGRPAEEVAAAWLVLGPALVAITCGADGVVAVAAGTGLLRRPARRVSVVDTVGAGDAFTSALLAGLHRRGLLGAGRRAALAAIGEAPLTEVLDEAVLAAAITCTRRGADPPVLAELLG
jgi:fructokinase